MRESLSQLRSTELRIGGKCLNFVCSLSLFTFLCLSSNIYIALSPLCYYSQAVLSLLIIFSSTAGIKDKIIWNSISVRFMSLLFTHSTFVNITFGQSFVYNNILLFEFIMFHEGYFYVTHIRNTSLRACTLLLLLAFIHPVHSLSICCLHHAFQTNLIHGYSTVILYD